MKIVLDIPDWVEGKHLYVMAGIELVAYKYLHQPWKVKTSRCNLCGKCCMDFKSETKGYQIVGGRCVHLEPDGDKWVCSLGANRPWSCCVGVAPKGIPKCTEKFE